MEVRVENVTSLIEDIISEYKDSPNLLNELKKRVKPGEYNPLHNDDPFGDEKLGRIIYEAINGKPLDMGYISGLGNLVNRDFSEIETEGNSVFINLDDNTEYNSLNFKKLLVSPMIVTDWPNHKHEMIGSFDFDMIPRDKIVEEGKMENLVDQVTIPLLNLVSSEYGINSVPAGMTDSELMSYFESNPSDYFSALSELEDIAGPDIDDLYQGFEKVVGEGKTTLAEDVVYTLTHSRPDDYMRAKASLKEIYDSPESDFSEGDFGIRAVMREFINKFKRNRKKDKERYKEAYEGMKDIVGEDMSELVMEKVIDGSIPMTEDVSHLLKSDHKRFYKQMRYGHEHPEYKNFPTDFYNMRLSGLPVPDADPLSNAISDLLVESKSDLISPISKSDAIIILLSSDSPEAELSNICPRMKPGDFYQVYKNFSTSNELENNLAENLKESSSGDTKYFLDKRKFEISKKENSTHNPNFPYNPGSKSYGKWEG